MIQTKILLLDFNPACGLGGTLRGILESSVFLDVQIHQECVGICGPAFYENDLPRITSGFSPALILLVLSPGLMEQTGTLIQSIRRLSDVPILVVIEAGEPDGMFEILRFREVDFITSPLKIIDTLPRVWRLLEQARWRDILKQTLKEKLGFKQLIGESPAFLAEVEKVPLVAKCDASILISGETGTGKDVFARAIHYLSPRASKPFISVDCGAIPVELMENELFGHERGAFTGATTSRLGIIHEANRGTLLLDEVDCLPLQAQVKLLRFLQEKEYRSLGSTKICKADVRVIAASNIDFEEAVRTGRFRQDLYYRLNVVPLRLPPLRERQEDIPLLARHFLAKYTFEFNKRTTNFSAEAMQKLMLYQWPGNVRELEHVVEGAVVLSQRGVIESSHIVLPRMETSAPQRPFQEMKAEIITRFEKSYILGLLVANEGNITKAANAAHKNRRAFWQLINKHRIDVQSIKLQGAAQR